jgi:hypothetical protein
VPFGPAELLVCALLQSAEHVVEVEAGGLLALRILRKFIVNGPLAGAGSQFDPLSLPGEARWKRLPDRYRYCAR